MRTVEVDIQQYFGPVKGQLPWRARRGVGSFLTFDFGRRISREGRQYGQWRLWIYQANWVLMHADRQLANSESKSNLIDIAVRRLEQIPLTQVEIDDKLNTKFTFGDFFLTVTAADYLDKPDKGDEYWLFFTPENEVLTVGPSGINIGPSSDKST